MDKKIQKKLKFSKLQLRSRENECGTSAPVCSPISRLFPSSNNEKEELISSVFKNSRNNCSSNKESALITMAIKKNNTVIKENKCPSGQTKIDCNVDVTFNDFAEPKVKKKKIPIETQTNRAVTRSKKTSVVITRKKQAQSRDRKQTDIRKAIAGRSDEKVYTDLVNSQMLAEKLNPESLQMAIALSRSMIQDCELDKDSNGNGEYYPDTQERLCTIRTTLEQYGFKNAKEAKRFTTGSNKKRMQYDRFSLLLNRNNKEQERIIAERISDILDQSENCIDICMERDELAKQPKLWSEFLNYFICDDKIAFNKSRLCLDEMHELDIFYTNLFEMSFVRCGVLLKSWSDIPGRESSPEPDMIRGSATEKSHDEIQSTEPKIIQTISIEEHPASEEVEIQHIVSQQVLNINNPVIKDNRGIMDLKCSIVILDMNKTDSDHTCDDSANDSMETEISIQKDLTCNKSNLTPEVTNRMISAVSPDLFSEYSFEDTVNAEHILISTTISERTNRTMQDDLVLEMTQTSNELPKTMHGELFTKSLFDQTEMVERTTKNKTQDNNSIIDTTVRTLEKDTHSSAPTKPQKSTSTGVDADIFYNISSDDDLYETSHGICHFESFYETPFNEKCSKAQREKDISFNFDDDDSQNDKKCEDNTGEPKSVKKYSNVLMNENSDKSYEGNESDQSVVNSSISSITLNKRHKINKSKVKSLKQKRYLKYNLSLSGSQVLQTSYIAKKSEDFIPSFDVQYTLGKNAATLSKHGGFESESESGDNDEDHIQTTTPSCSRNETGKLSKDVENDLLQTNKYRNMISRAKSFTDSTSTNKFTQDSFKRTKSFKETSHRNNNKKCMHQVLDLTISSDEENSSKNSSLKKDIVHDEKIDSTEKSLSTSEDSVFMISDEELNYSVNILYNKNRKRSKVRKEPTEFSKNSKSKCIQSFDDDGNSQSDILTDKNKTSEELESSLIKECFLDTVKTASVSAIHESKENLHMNKNCSLNLLNNSLEIVLVSDDEPEKSDQLQNIETSDENKMFTSDKDKGAVNSDNINDVLEMWNDCSTKSTDLYDKYDVEIPDPDKEEYYYRSKNLHVLDNEQRNARSVSPSPSTYMCIPTVCVTPAVLSTCLENKLKKCKKPPTELFVDPEHKKNDNIALNEISILRELEESHFLRELNSSDGMLNDYKSDDKNINLQGTMADIGNANDTFLNGLCRNIIEESNIKITSKSEGSTVSLCNKLKRFSSLNKDIVNSEAVNKTSPINIFAKDNFKKHHSAPCVLEDELHFQTYDFGDVDNADMNELEKCLNTEVNYLMEGKINLKDKVTQISTTPQTTEDSLAVNDCPYVFKSGNVTPKPEYERMNTPTMLQELKKYGLKPLKRKRATQILEYIYDQTHPIVADYTDSEPHSKRMKTSEAKSTTTTNCHSKHKHSDAGSSKILNAGHLQSSDSHIQVVSSRKETDIDLCGVGLQIYKPDDEFILPTKYLNTKISSCVVPLNVAFYNLVSFDSELHESILRYEPIDLEKVYMDLKSHGYRYNPKDLLTFFDKMCITVKTKTNRNHKLAKNSTTAKSKPSDCQKRSTNLETSELEVDFGDTQQSTCVAETKMSITKTSVQKQTLKLTTELNEKRFLPISDSDTD